MSSSGSTGWDPGPGSSADYGYGESSAPRYSSSPFTSTPHSTSPFGEPAAPPASASGAHAPQTHDPYAGAYPDAVQVRRTNPLATVSLVLSLAGLVTNGLTAVVGVILGHIARSQIRRTGEQGAGLALAGLIVGYGLIVLITFLVIGYLLLVLFVMPE